jgi:hypothetical protein
MEFEERVRRGLRRAGLDSYGWVELLALKLLPAPSQWRDGSLLWEFLVPANLIASIVTGTRAKRRSRNHWANSDQCPNRASVEVNARVRR